MSYNFPYSDSDTNKSIDFFFSLEDISHNKTVSNLFKHQLSPNPSSIIETRSVLEILGYLSPTDAKELIELLNIKRQNEIPISNEMLKKPTDKISPFQNGMVNQRISNST